MTTGKKVFSVLLGPVQKGQKRQLGRRAEQASWLPLTERGAGEERK